ncbi:hypothetical protein LAZ67_4000846 [Cordylochernes scorpioides]|uniref:Integrase catalytic domain-containing protein n=1 Tax=Cordylochernes scorpioides TaxID=51811 RepID=A0ABY6KCL1_9ARAC|nr:hypothetical protein LAZ67_4000846 [Cordylochernes scorpioides]
MEEHTNPSNDTAEQTIPKQETTFEEEETLPPQDNSADPLTQIADALSKLLVARSPREIDVSPYDGSFEAQSFFDNFDAQADRAELTYTDRLRKLPCYLQARQRLIDLFPATTEASFARFLAIKLTPQMPLEDYYQNKTVMGMKLDLPADILIESLTDGLPVADQRLIATVQPNTIKEWFDIVSRIRGTQCATSAVYQRQVDKAPHPTYHNPPPRYNNQRPSRVTVNNGSHGTEHAQSTAPDHAQPLYQNVVPTPSPRSNLRAMFPKSKLQVKTTLQAPRAPQRSCHTCQIIKRPKDTIAGFSKYGHSKTYLHLIVDHLTRYAWTFPSKSTSTLTYIQTLKTVLQQGSPKRLLSDRAPAFTSEKFRKFLIIHDKGADLTIPDKCGDTPLIRASSLEMVTLLAEMKADLNATNNYGDTALRKAVEFEHVDIVKFLIDNGADVNTQNKLENTPLIHAAQINNLEIVKLLIDGRAEIDITNNNGYTALCMAAKWGSSEIVKYLVVEGADLNVKVKNGKPLLMMPLLSYNTEFRAGEFKWESEERMLTEPYLDIVKFLIQVQPCIEEDIRIIALEVAIKRCTKDNEEEDDIEIDHRTRPETSELNEETIPTLDEPNEERIVRSGRKKGDTQKVLEEKHRAKLREEEMKLLEQGVRRSQRIKERNNVNFILEPEERIPENYEEAINCENKYEWLEAMKEELYSIDKHKHKEYAW